MANPTPPTDAAALRDDSWVDEALAPFTFFVDALASASAAAVPGSDYIESLWVEHLAIQMPFEMDVRVEDDGKVKLAGAPPTQYTETTIMPVFHGMRLTVTGEMNLAGDSEPKLAS